MRSPQKRHRALLGRHFLNKVRESSPHLVVVFVDLVLLLQKINGLDELGELGAALQQQSHITKHLASQLRVLALCPVGACVCDQGLMAVQLIDKCAKDDPWRTSLTRSGLHSGENLLSYGLAQVKLLLLLL